MKVIGIYGRPGNVALVVIAALVTAAGARPAWRDPKYHKDSEVEKDLDAVVIDPAAPNAAAVAKAYANRTVMVDGTTAVPKPAEVFNCEDEDLRENALRKYLNLPAKPPVEKKESAGGTSTEPPKEPNGGAGNGTGDNPERIPVEKLAWPQLKKIAKELNITAPDKKGILAELAAQNVSAVAASVVSESTNTGGGE